MSSSVEPMETTARSVPSGPYTGLPQATANPRPKESSKTCDHASFPLSAALRYHERSTGSRCPIEVLRPAFSSHMMIKPLSVPICVVPAPSRNSLTPFICSVRLPIRPTSSATSAGEVRSA